MRAFYIIQCLVLGSLASAEASAQVVDELTKLHGEINLEFTRSIATLNDAKRAAPLCTQFAKDLIPQVDESIEELEGFQAVLDAEIKKMKSSVKIVPVTKGTNICDGANADLSKLLLKEKGLVETAKKRIATNFTAPLARKIHEFYSVPKKMEANLTVMGFAVKTSAIMTKYDGMVKALAWEEKWPKCPRTALPNFHKFADKKSRDGHLDAIPRKMKALDQFFVTKINDFESRLASIKDANCDTLLAEADKKKAEDSKLAEEKKAKDAEAAKLAAAKKKEEEGRLALASARAEPEKKPEPEVKAEVKAEDVKKTDKGSSGAVASALKEQKISGTSETEKAAFLAANEAPATEPASAKIAYDVENLAPESERVVASVEKPAVEPVSESDKWKKGDADFWKKGDDYKENTLGVINKIENADQRYQNFLQENSVKITSAEDQLRLQKAINATSMHVNGPDAVGVSVYQDGLVGVRTKSAAVLMTDPAYKATFLAELKKQGLIR